MTLNVTLQDGCDRAGIVLGSTANSSGYEIAIDKQNNRLAVLNRDGTVCVMQVIDDLSGRKIQLRVLVDGDIVEVFCADRYALAARLSESVRSESVALFAQGPAEFEEIGVYRLRTLHDIAPAAPK